MRRPPNIKINGLKWYEEGRFVHIYPEVIGGLSTPSPDAQRQGERVVTGVGADVTEPFMKGAQATLRLATEHQVELAILNRIVLLVVVFIFMMVLLWIRRCQEKVQLRSYYGRMGLRCSVKIN